MNKRFLISACCSAILLSCSERSTDFVNSNTAELEEALFRSNNELIRRGAYFKFNLESQLEPETPENKLKLSKLRMLYNQIKAIDERTGELIQKIDALKMDLLKRNGENIQFGASNLNDGDKLVWAKYDTANPLLPARLNLEAIDPGKFPEVNTLTGLNKPISKGRRLWDDLNDFRADIVNLTASYNLGKNAFSLQVKPINSFKDNQALNEKVKQMISSSQANLKEDTQVLQDIYVQLTKREKDNRGVHWITSQFGDLPLVAMVNNLSMLQNEILRARTLALALISSKFGNCGNTLFTEIQFTMLAPEKAKRNEEVKMHVFLAAYEYFLKPAFTCSQGENESYKNGIAVMRIKAGGEKEMKLNGTVSFELPYGDVAILPWEKTVRIED